MKKLVISILCVMSVFIGFSQTGVTGKVVDSKTQKPLQNVVATIQNTSLTQVTDATGKFTFKDVPVGSQLVQINSSGYKNQLLSVDIEAGKMLDLGTISFEEDITSEQQLTLVTITDNDLNDDNSGSESTSALLQASRDAFQQAAAFNWGQARFRVRGLDNQYGNVMINGVSMNKVYDGRPQWSNWGGLNDATRNQEFTTGSAPSDYTFGGILGTQEINTRASIYRKGTRLTFSGGNNANYNWRTMGTHASGMNKAGWAFVVSASRRWAEEGYNFDGTTYSANSLFASVEKKFNDNHSLNFTSIYADNRRGKNSPNTAEVTNLEGQKYNSYWGYQDGEKRNSREKIVNEPIIMLTHYWKMNAKTNLTTSITHQFGKIGNSRLDYFNAPNPDPTYYRNLPSYYTSQYIGSTFVGNTPENLANAANAQFFRQNQIDWKGLYYANSITSDGSSVYVLYEDRTDDKTWGANSTLSAQLADNISMNGGIAYKRTSSHNYQLLTDLLGGGYLLDIDTFGTNANQQQSDLNHPNRMVGVGDEYGYNYDLVSNVFDAFTQFKFTYKKVDFYLAESYTRTDYQRDGLYRNGYYAYNSYGKSQKLNFENFGFKGGLTYKITGKHFLNFNGVYMTKAPSLRNSFFNARINNNVIEDLDSEKIVSADGSYIIRSSKFKARLTGYFSRITNSVESSFFFADGVAIDDGDPNTEDASSNFVAETVTGINKLNIGGELGIEYQVTSTIKLTASAAYGQYTYDNNPNVSLSKDAIASQTNPNPITDFGSAKLKGYRQAGMPQEAYSVGIEYRDPHFWWIGANANYLASNYIDVAPLTRTDNFFRNPSDPFGLPFTDINDDRARELLKQEKFDNFYLVNLTGGKSWRVDNVTIGTFASINNLFDVTYKTGGFEQARNANYKELNQDVSSGTPAFAPKYFYGFGRTYFVNLYVNF